MKTFEEYFSESSADIVAYVDDKGKLVSVGKLKVWASGGWIDNNRAVPNGWKAVYTVTELNKLIDSQYYGGPSLKKSLVNKPRN